MFRELGKLKDAERLLRERKFAEVLALARDPEIREHKRAQDALAAASKGLLDEARADLDAGRLAPAAQKARLARDAGDPGALELEGAIREAANRAEAAASADRRARGDSAVRAAAQAAAASLVAAAERGDPAELAILIRDARMSGVDAGDALDRAATALVNAVRARLDRGGEPSAMMEALAVFPAGTASDDDGVALKLTCREQGRAARARLVADTLAAIEPHVAAGRLADAREIIAAALKVAPDAYALQEWSEALAASAAELEALFAEAHAALAAGDIRRARRTALRIRLRGTRPPDFAALLDEIARRDEEAQRAAVEAEKLMLRGGGALAAAAGVRKRPAFVSGYVPAPTALLPGDPFMLRIENEGDWLVHPGSRITIGNRANGEADLQVLAAIGARHATIERTFRDDGTARYRILAGERQAVTRNGRDVRVADLEPGDRIQLGRALTFTFERPDPGNATAVLRLHGDFAIEGTTRVILFAECGRKGAVLVAPGSDGHAPLRGVDARLEILRADQGEEAGELFARSPSGVAVGDAQERAQVRVRAGQALSVGALRLHVDALPFAAK